MSPVHEIAVQISGGQASVVGAAPVPLNVTALPVTVPVVAHTALGPPGRPGPPGEDAKWANMTQAEYDALPAKDPQTLYVIIG